MVGVHFLYFHLLPRDERFQGYHHVFELRERHTGHRLTDHLELHTLEMMKFSPEQTALRDPEQKWLFFLKHGHEMTTEEVRALGVPEIVEADRRLTMISQDRILQVQYEQRLKAERDAFAYAEDRWKTGKKEGLKEGKKEAMAEAILSVLTARGLTLSDEANARILACTDSALLARWLLRAATVQSSAEVLSEP